MKSAFKKGVQQKNIIIDLNDRGIVGQPKVYKLGEERTLEGVKILGILAITNEEQSTPDGRTVAPNAKNACFLTLKDAKRNVIWEDMSLRHIDPNENGLDGAIEIASQIVNFHESNITIIHAASHVNESIYLTVLYEDQ